MSENEEKSTYPLLALSPELPELPWSAGALHVQHFRDNPGMRNIEFAEASDFDAGSHPLFTADQMRAYATEAVLRAANAREGGVEVKAGTSCTMFELVDVTAAGVTDEMVERYCEAVEAHLGSLTPKDWEMERFDPKASVRSVARIGLIAALTPRIPGGWKLVPCEPTWDMRNEGREFLIDGIEKEPEKLAYFLWKTMLKAAPPTPGSEVGS